MLAWRVRSAVSVTTGGHSRVPPQGPHTQNGTAVHGVLGGRGAVAPLIPGSDFQPGLESRDRHAGSLRKSPASSGRWRSSAAECRSLAWPLASAARACAKATAAKDAGRHQEALRASRIVSACGPAVAQAERHPGAGALGAGPWRAEAQTLELSTRRSHTLSPADCRSLIQNAGLVR